MVLGHFSKLRTSHHRKASLRRRVARPERRPKERTGTRAEVSRTLCAPQPTSSSRPPAHSTRSSLIGREAAGSRCHWPGVHGGGRRETYLREPPQECYCARRWPFEAAVEGGKAGSLRRRCRYVGDGREPRASGGCADRRLSGGRALPRGPAADASERWAGAEGGCGGAGCQPSAEALGLRAGRVAAREGRKDARPPRLPSGSLG